MKKQYLIGLLGFVTIFVPLANGLLTTNSKLFNSTYTNNEIQNEFIINDQNSQVIVKDLDHDGKASQGDQIDQIQLNANYNEFYSIYEDKTETILSNEYGLNIYTKNSTNTIKLFYSISYDHINNLNLNQNEGYLNLDLNSIDNPTWKIWDTKLPDNSQEFIITAESKKNNHQEKYIENNIGEIPIASYSDEQQREPEITSAIVSDSSVGLSNVYVTIDYEIDLGNNGNGGINNEYDLRKLEVINKENGKQIDCKEKTNGSLPNKWKIYLVLDRGVDYNLLLKATFYNPKDDSEIYTDEEYIEDGKFSTKEKKPQFDYPSAVKIDMQHNILELQGTIDTKGSKVESIWITNKNHDVETWIYQYDDNENTIYYDIWTPDYIENNVGDIASYKLGIWYTLNGTTSYDTTGLRQFDEDKVTTNEDLSNLEEKSSCQGNTSGGASGGDNSSGGGGSDGGGSWGNGSSNNTITTIAIIIGVVLFVVIISFIGYYLLRKYK